LGRHDGAPTRGGPWSWFKKNSRLVLPSHREVGAARPRMLHAARYRDKLEPSGRCTASEAAQLARQLRPLLSELGACKDHPGLLREHAVDSVGRDLDASNPEPLRSKLSAWESGPHAACEATVFLRRKEHEIVSVEAAEKLPHGQRLQCTPIRGSNELARRLEVGERGMAELVIEFAGGASLSVRQQKQPERMLVLLVSRAKKRKVLQGVLRSAGAAAALEALFADAGRGARGAPPIEPIEGKLVAPKNSGPFWSLPSWYAEIMGQVAQDVFRLHVLTSASSADVARPLYVDRVQGHRLDGPMVDVAQQRTVIKAILHRASGGCICGLHRVKPRAEWKRLEVRFELCAACTADEKGCARHRGSDSPVESVHFPGVCAKNFKVEFWCVHELPPPAAKLAEGVDAAPGRPDGTRLLLTSAFTDKHADAAWLKAPLLDLACCGARLMSQPRDAQEARDLRADAERVVQELARARVQRKQTSELMRERDAAAVWLLRRGGVGVGGDGRLHGTAQAPVTSKQQHVSRTHAHLFRKLK